MEHDIDAGRERADAPDIAMPLHARRLRAALLSSPRFARPADGAARLIHLFITHMTTKRKFALASAKPQAERKVFMGQDSWGLEEEAEEEGSDETSPAAVATNPCSSCTM